METAINERVNRWLEGTYDEETQTAIRRMQANSPEELSDAFYKDLEFGTGGLRGIMGVGTNRMNKYTVAMATQGLANYLKQQFSTEVQKVVIAYDSRNNSAYFSEITADVLSANGVKVYVFDTITPTPELSFAIRHLHCHSGIVITASHNPKEYNGYKVYWQDGGQLVAPHDHRIIAEVKKITRFEEVRFERKAENVSYIGEEVHQVYIERVKALSMHPEIIRKQHDLKIVYTPLHGTGVYLVPRALRAFGFSDVSLVEAQAVPDGNFSTVVSPNPEEIAAMSMAIEEAKERNADIVLATDPDADRIGLAVKKKDQDYELLNGNMTLTLLIYYMLKEWKKKGKINGRQFVVKTIVTTELVRDIAQKEGVACYDVLTGFKFIAEKILHYEGEKEFIAGGEESFGCLVGDFVRDKDAVISCSILAEMAAWAKEQGKTLYDVLIDIYMEYGLYKEHLISITKKGQQGSQEIKRMMQSYRSEPPKEINGSKVIRIDDILLLQSFDCRNNHKKSIHDLPQSDVLQFFLADGSKITVRPSGTEPKIKFYFSVKENLVNRNQFDAMHQKLTNKINNIIQSMKL
ncbi:MAG: phospho-sugar mutase [Bacteroidales bacterium]|jgi:phosphoglucomutase|nr:phospho-sugar mutase [Bacteroidales bacterium]MDD2687330.1 phospho-sugar mutase [Bacteroidales bacterium]MDD3329950.1 phospho-sugar mutase [Bacteroidales bacterium]MDD3690795.1 phospho-sugar mutase [Bacteroidales bacterium]MDD4044643.1 phospho-sugar mutase [Bacteroidales bacterium]